MCVWGGRFSLVTGGLKLGKESATASAESDPRPVGSPSAGRVDVGRTDGGTAVVTVDGKQTAGPTPVSLDVRAGPHTIAVHHDGYTTETRPLESRFGRAVIVWLDLVRGGAEKR